MTAQELIVIWLGHLLRSWGALRGALVAGSGAKFLERTAEARYLHAVGVSEGTTVQVPGCEDLQIAVSELWAEG